MTSIAENTARGTPSDVAAELPDSFQVNPNRDRSKPTGALALRHEEFRTADPDKARRFFADAYTPGWRIMGLHKESAVHLRRCTAGSMSLDDVVIQGRARFEIPGHSVSVIQPRAGSLTVAGHSTLDANCPVLVARDMACVLQFGAARFSVVNIPESVLRKAAVGQHAPLPEHIRFLDWRPRSRAGVRAWHRALDFATATLSSEDTNTQPLIAASVGTVLATALLECYPSNLTVASDIMGDPALPDPLKDAVSYIHSHAARDVGVQDVAAAVHLTPRAVQYLFRHQLDTTPTRYLRGVRLQGAHRDLIASSRSTTTVADIAGRWGFQHTGRFAVLYRQTYGQSPHTTLRQ